MPWQEGFSVYHFYTKLKNFIPKNLNTNLNAIHYASPGYMKIKMDTDIADKTFNAINDYAINKKVIDNCYNTLYERIKELGLNQMRSSQAITCFDADKYCKDYFIKLVNLTYNINIEWLNKFAVSDFERSKIIMAHIRRLKQFHSYLEDGRVRVVTDILKDIQGKTPETVGIAS